MSSNRFQKTVQEVDKDLANTEKFLSKVLRRQIPKTQGSSKHKNIKQNVHSERGVKPFLTGPSSRPRSSTAGLKAGASSPSQNKQFNQNYFHRDCLGSFSPMVEAKGKSKSKDRQRKRSLSAGKAVPEKPENRRLSKTNETSKQTNITVQPACSNPCSKVSQPKPVKCSDSKHLPWSQVLKENRIAWSADKNNGPFPSGKCKFDPGKLSASTKSTIKSNLDTFERNAPKCVSLESRPTSHSGGSSGFDSSVDSGEHFVNKSVQCWIPQVSTAKECSITSVPLSKVPEEVDPKSAADTFSMFDPVRTLNFLVRELHGFIRKSPAEDHNLHRIVTDMERVLHRIPQDLRGGDVGNFAVFGNILDQDAKQTETITMPLVLKVDSSLLSASTITSESTSLIPKRLEESCLKLEAMCREMEIVNRELRQERDRFEGEVKMKSQEIEGLLAKERDYVQAISTLRCNLEGSVKAQSDLTSLSSNLREDNQNLRETESKLKEQYQGLMRANEQLKKDLKMLQLEKEKLLVLNHSKDNELENFKRELMEIKTEVAQHLTEFRTQVKEIRHHPHFRDLDVSNDSTEAESIPSEATSPRRLVCSSPNSSKSSIPKVARSWQIISSIPPENSVAEFLALSPIKEQLSFKSMDGDSADASAELSDQCDSVNNQQTRSKGGQELKVELKNLFKEMKKKTKLSSSNISIPSPPHQFSVLEPEGVSQLSIGSSVDSLTTSISELDSKMETENN